jgi:lysophospholipase L1-like esterase
LNPYLPVFEPPASERGFAASMDVFCRCDGCPGCSEEGNELGGACSNPPQKYVNRIQRRDGEVKTHDGFRKFCKPCLRAREKARQASNRAARSGGDGASGSARGGYDAVSANRPRIVLFGDSITEQSFGEGGFGAALANRYARRADVILRGYSGYNTRMAVGLLPYVFPLDDPNPPVLVTVCFGANDAVKPGSTMESKQGCPSEEYRNNLRAILEHLHKLSPRPRVLVMTPPPLDAIAWKKTCDDRGYHADPEPDRSMSVTESYARVALEAAEVFSAVNNRAKVTGLNLFIGLQRGAPPGAPGGWEKAFLSDGLHLTPGGYRRAFELMVPVIEGKLGLALAASEDPSDFPPFLDVPNDRATAKDAIDAFAAKRMKTDP